MSSIFPLSKEQDASLQSELEAALDTAPSKALSYVERVDRLDRFTETLRETIARERARLEAQLRDLNAAAARLGL